MASRAHDLGAAAEFAAGSLRRVEVEGRALVVLRQGEEFFALRDRCPHQGAPLSAGHLGGTPLPCRPGEPVEYGRLGEVLTCPWHGWEFDVRTGRALANPQARVRAYPVRREGERLLVELS
jgi:3-phenylpropionate/trans-cinnamate dioxygenase ferredoxin subunit